MRVVKVSLKPVGEPGRARTEGPARSNLLAYCSVTVGGERGDNGELAIHDIKLVLGREGPVVSMPSRKLCDHCHCCQSKNHLRARFCNECGARLADGRVTVVESDPADDRERRARLFVDVVHPICTSARQDITQAVLRAWEETVSWQERNQQEPQGD